MNDAIRLIRAAQSRPLRPGEVQALTLALESLQARVADLEAMLAARRDENIAERPTHVELSLASGALECHFPGAHSVRIPHGETQHQRATAMDLIVSILRERTGGAARVAEAGAPVQSDVRELLRGKAATRIPPKGRRRISHEEIDSILEDIDI